MLKNTQLVTWFILLYICTPFSAKAQKAKIDTNIVNTLVKQTKSIHNINPELGIKLLDSLCGYYLQLGRTNDFYITKTNLGHCYNVLQKNLQAISVYESCTKYFIEKNDSLYLFHNYNGIGNVNYNLKNYVKANEYYALAGSFCNEFKYPQHKFLAYQNFANSFIELGKFDSVFVYYKKAADLLPVLQKTKPELPYRLKINYAYAYYKSNQYQLALKDAESIINFYRSRNDISFLMRIYEITGLSYLGLKKYDKAKKYIDSTYFLNNQYKSLSNAYDIVEDYYRIDTSLHDYKNANIHLRQMLTLRDSLFEENKTNLASDLLIKYETEKKEAEKDLLELENEQHERIIKLQKFLIILIVILSAIIILSLYLYLRYRNKQQKQLFDKEKIETELKALKAQLNPHFIQNIFQIIANQLLLNPEKVGAFLQKTSDYLRSVLNNSDKNQQNLEDELLFTEKYLQFQQSIFSDKLTYEINIANNVDSIGIKVPTMLLQPFVENSIKYGLQISQQPTHILITVKNDNQYLSIVIIDNGRSNKIVSNENKKSFGNSLVERRLKLFYQKSKYPPKFHTQYLNDGFEVNIAVPLQ